MSAFLLFCFIDKKLRVERVQMLKMGDLLFMFLELTPSGVLEKLTVAHLLSSLSVRNPMAC
jgi:hypothetical protein